MPARKYKKTLHRKKSNQPPVAQPGEKDHSSFFGPSTTSGQALPESTRGFFEPRFGQDFSAVRVHHDEEAARSAQSIAARAYTTGRDIVFNQGQYAPDTLSGKQLLAHELTHVIQQEEDGQMIQRWPPTHDGDEKTFGHEAGHAAPQQNDSGPGDDMKLPCETYLGTFEEQDIDGIRILIGMATKDRKGLKTVKAIANAITTANKMISDPAFQVKFCVITDSTSEFVLFKGQPALVIDSADATAETAHHEMGHAVFHFLCHNKGSQIDATTKSGEWLEGLTDIYLQLKQIVLNVGTAREMTANWIVDASEWKRGAKGEHPKDVDEFFASATEAYRTNKSALQNTFQEYGRHNRAVRELGTQLLATLDFLYAGKGTAVQPRTPGDKQITGEWKLLKEPNKLEEVRNLPQNGTMNKLLDPTNRADCKKPPPAAKLPASKSPGPTTDAPKK
jgi:hypothetical protein